MGRSRVNLGGAIEAQRVANRRALEQLIEAEEGLPTTFRVNSPFGQAVSQFDPEGQTVSASFEFDPGELTAQRAAERANFERLSSSLAADLQDAFLAPAQRAVAAELGNFVRGIGVAGLNNSAARDALNSFAEELSFNEARRRAELELLARNQLLNEDEQFFGQAFQPLARGDVLVRNLAAEAGDAADAFVDIRQAKADANFRGGVQTSGLLAQQELERARQRQAKNQRLFSLARPAFGAFF